MSEFSKIIIDWYQSNKRDLPWRNTEDPFLIWVSEIILQQTRVVQGIDYYYKITNRFPNIKSLADAQEDELLKLWQGLGYYSRARNMLKAANQLAIEHNYQFPKTFEEILQLKGIGKYTASAIGSFAFNLPTAVVDGNVYRVLARVFGIEEPIDQEKSRKTFDSLAQELLDKEKPGVHNQAIMEFGALQCVPVNPDCSICPLAPHCIALHLEKVDQLPMKSRKTSVQKKFFNYIHISVQGHTLLYQRQESNIWKGLWEFPVIETESMLNDEDILTSDFLLKVSKLIGYSVDSLNIQRISKSYKHLLSHREIHAKFISIEISSELVLENIPDVNHKLFKLAPMVELENYAVHRLMEKFIEKL